MAPSAGDFVVLPGIAISALTASQKHNDLPEAKARQPIPHLRVKWRRMFEIASREIARSLCHFIKSLVPHNTLALE